MTEINIIIKKLRKMSADELVFRAGVLGYKKIEKIKHMLSLDALTDEGFLKYYVNIADKTPEALLKYMRGRRNVEFFVKTYAREKMLAIIDKYYPEVIDKARKKADKICNYEFSFLGVDVRYSDISFSWHTDPISHKQWPIKFYSDIDISTGNAEYGDVKYIWEINRHQFFIDLGKAYWLSGNERYAQKFVRFISDWIVNNPYKIGINWTSALEVAVRVISWIWAYYFCLYSHHITPEINLKILKLIYQHGEYLSKHLSFYSSPYNHLIGELSALFIIGSIFPEFKYADKWRDNSWQRLQQELSRQFHTDGATVEQAMFYHHFTLGFYLMVVLLKEMNDNKVSEDVWNVIERAIEFSMYMTKPDGLIPMIGDVDNARSIYIASPPMWDFRSFPSIGAVIFNRGDMKKVAGGFHEDALWLLGVDGLDRYQNIVAVEPECKSRAFYNSGYYIMRSGWNKDDHYLCFDCGEIAAGLFKDAIPSAAHGHADMLSFELVVYGYPMIIDPGFYTYNGDYRLHCYFRQSNSHNTATVDNQSQAVHPQRLTLSNVPEHSLKKWVTTDEFDVVIGAHDGYRRLHDPVEHQRMIFFKKYPYCYWIIEDIFHGKEEHVIDVYFHFVSEIMLTKKENNTSSRMVIAKNAKNIGIVMVTVSNNINIEIVDSGVIPDGGWIAPGYGYKLRAPILKYTGRLKLPVSIQTVIYPFKDDILPEIDIDTVMQDMAECMTKV